ncbi:MAG: hypothetical protein DHS80DRAFT_29700 [Piptocephalis tieghemiana]|nr:MAG: hypothetical protein DHS80DRAFT_29700 [Piptocephalis tieghemiana]
MSFLASLVVSCILGAQAGYAAAPAQPGQDNLGLGHGEDNSTASCAFWDPLKMLELVNDIRIKNGVNTLDFLPELNHASAYTAWKMAKDDIMFPEKDTSSANPINHWKRTGPDAITAVSQNTAFGLKKIEDVVRLWKSSPDTRSIMIERNHTHFGVAVWFSDENTPYYAQTYAHVGNGNSSSLPKSSSVPGPYKTCGTTKTPPSLGPSE